MNQSQWLISGGNIRDLREDQHLAVVVLTGLHQTCHVFVS